MNSKSDLQKKQKKLMVGYGIDDKFFGKKEEEKYSLGLSLYPEKSDLNDMISFLEKARDVGFNHVFTNMLAIKSKEDKDLSLFKKPLNHARKLGYQVIVDTAPKVYSNLGFLPGSKESLEFLDDHGATGVRFDLDYGGKIEADTSKKIKVEINASTIDTSTAKSFIKNKGNLNNLTACHNFYPQKYTGLSEKFFRETSNQFKKLGVRVSAFVALNSNRETIGAWDINDGMPTLEMHRDKNLSYQIRWLFATNIVDQVLVSAQYPSEEEMRDISKITLGAINLVINLTSNISELEKEIILNVPHQVRGERGEYLAARCAWSRLLYKDVKIPAKKTSKNYFTKGDVVILNSNYGRYAGEVQVIGKTGVENDGRRNLVGFLNKDEMELLKEENIFNWRPLRFIEDK